MGWITRRVRAVLLSLVVGIFVPSDFPVAVLPAQEPAPRSVAKCLFGPSWSASTSTLLQHLGLADVARHHPDNAFSLIEQGTDSQNPDCKRLLALAELADRIGQTVATNEALVRSRDAAVYAVFCLETLPVDQVAMTIGCTARDVHNRAVERCLHLGRTGRSHWSARLAEVGIVTATTVSEWTALGFDRLEPAHDRVINRLGSVGRRPGFGVPVVAQRRLTDAELGSWKPYGPLEAVFAASATIRLTGPIQFWVVLYPSGNPLPVAAHALRRSLREIHQRFDPHEIDPGLDQMVILGKSTGGQVVRMLAEPSGEAVWNAVFTQPIDQVRATPAARAELASIFFFEPEPYVRRVIFVATAHRGSNLPLQPGVRLGVELIRRNNPLRPIWSDLKAANSAVVFQPSLQNRAPSSIDGMQAGSRLLTALDAQPIAPHIAYHSIIANIRRHAWSDQMSDGFVKYASAHLDGAASECIVTASHLCEADPEVIAEMRRILLAHASETKGTGTPSPLKQPRPGMEAQRPNHENSPVLDARLSTFP